MSSATDRLNNILLELPRHKSQWQLNVANPYVRAYDLALETFNRTTKAQEARNRATAELFVFAASVLTGSVMMAVFATSSLRVLAGRAALRVICNNNLNRTFDMMHAASNSKAVMFALGGILDEAKKVAGKQVTTAVEGLTSNAPIATSGTALNYMTRLEDFINTNHICVHNLVQGVRDDGSIGEADKAKVADLAVRSPFCNPPSGRRVDENRLSQKMELLFYMNAVLDSDRLVTYAPDTSGSPGSMGRELEFSSRPIAQLPSATDYPRATAPRFTGRPFASYEPGQRIEYESIGSVVRERVNTLSSQTGNGRFYPEQNVLERMLIDPTSNAQMAKAEQVINRLSTDARPRQFTEVRMI
ncbi:hypothetical protein HFC70_13605 [Agrobacterium sp. a22-2]|nr:hypothetical protein [Agrobacterium sp. a22-2]